MALLKGSSVLRISFCTERNSQKEMVPASRGDTTQLATMVPTLFQATASMEMPTAAKPTMAPTMEWVVDTGQPRILAINSQVPAARRADSIPKTRRSGFSAMMTGSTMPLRMVEVTSPPAR